MIKLLKKQNPSEKNKKVCGVVISTQNYYSESLRSEFRPRDRLPWPKSISLSSLLQANSVQFTEPATTPSFQPLTDQYLWLPTHFSLCYTNHAAEKVSLNKCQLTTKEPDKSLTLWLSLYWMNPCLNSVVLLHNSVNVLRKNVNVILILLGVCCIYTNSIILLYLPDFYSCLTGKSRTLCSCYQFSLYTPFRSILLTHFYLTGFFTPLFNPINFQCSIFK